MHALVLTGRHSSPGVRVQSVPEPAPVPDRLIVTVHAAGITRMEPTWITGWILPDGSERPPPVALGHEFAGTVLSVGSEATGFTVGQRVMGMIEPERDGAMAERVSAAPGQVVEIPDGLSDAIASTLPLAGLTAWQAMVRYGDVQPGQRVLIHGGAGAVGSFAIQIARWVGADVIATCRRTDAALCRELGASQVIDFESERFEDQTAAVDLVFDPIGGETQERSWGVLKRGGRLITIAGEQEDEPDQDRARSLGVSARWFLVDFQREELQRLTDLVLDGCVRPVIADEYRLISSTAAYDPDAPHRSGKDVMVASSAAAD